MTEDELFDVIVPPGVPITIIREVMEKFDVQLVDRPRRIKIGIMDGEERNMLAFRGDRETVEKVEAYMMEKLREFIEGEEAKKS